MDIQNIFETAKNRGLSAIDSIKKSITPKPQSALSSAYETYKKIEPVIGAVQGIAREFQVPKEQLPQVFNLPVTSKTGEIVRDYSARVSKPLKQSVNLITETGKLNPITLPVTLANKVLDTSQKLGRLPTVNEAIDAVKPNIGLEEIFAPFDIANQAVVQPIWSNAKINIAQLRKQLGLPTIDLPQKPTELRVAGLTGIPTKEGVSQITWNDVIGFKEPTAPKSQSLEDQFLFNQDRNRYQVNRFIDSIPEILAPGPGELIAAGGILKEIKPEFLDNAIKEFKAGESLSKEAENFIKNTFKSVSDVRNYLSEQVGGVRQILQKDKELLKTSDEFSKYVREEKAIRDLERKAPTTIKEKLNKLWEDYKFNFETQQEQIYQTLKKVEKTYGEIKPSENPIYKLGLLYKSSKATEEYLVKNGFYKILEEANKIGSGDEFGQLLHDRRILTIAAEQGKTAKDAARKEEFVAKTLPKYKDLIVQYDNFMKGLLRHIFDNGLIDNQEYQRLKQLKDYAPFQRVFNELETPTPAQVSKTPLGTVSDPKIVRELQDIENTIHENPLESTIYYTYRAIDKINQNKFARQFGDLIKQGKVEGSQMLRIAEDVVRRKALIDDVEELKKVRDKVRNFIKKKNIQVGVLEKEANDLAKRGINLSLTKTSTETIDPVLKERLNQKINLLIKDRNKLAKEIEKLNIKDLQLAEDKAYFGFEEGLPKVQTQAILDKRVVNKEQFLLKTLFKTDALVKEKAVKYLNKNYGLLFNKMTDKQLLDFFRSSSPDELETFVNLAFDLTPKGYTSFIKKINASKSKEAEVLKEIDNAKNAAFTNKIVSALYKNEQDIRKQLPKLSQDFRKVMAKIDKAKANIYYNDLFNSLVKKSPEELEIINKQLTKKEKNIKGIVETITDGQKKLDEVSGYIKQREEEIKKIAETPSKGKSIISWFQNGTREIAEVPKELAESFQIANDYGATSEILNMLGKTTQAWKSTVVGLNPVSQLRQFLKDQYSLLFFTSPRAKLSVLNPLNFLEAAYGVTGSSPALQNFLSKAPLAGKFFERQAKKAREEYKRFTKLGGGQSSLDALKRDNVRNFVESGTKSPKVLSFKNAEKIASKAEETSRFELYLIQKKHYLRKGYSNKDAELKAVYDSNNLLPNYFEKGKYSRVLEIASVFSNAKFKSGRALRRYIAEKPAEATFSILTLVGIPTAAVTYWNLSDEKRRQAYFDLPEWTKELGLVILPTNPTKNEEGKWDYNFVIQEENLAGLAQGFRRATEIAMSEDPDKVQQFLKGTLDTSHDIVLSLTGQDIPFLASSPEKASENLRQSLSTGQPLIRSTFEVASGFDLFKGSPIENKSDESKYPYERFSPKTSLLARDLSKYLFDNGIKNVSPKEIDFFLNANFPGIFQYAREGLDYYRNQYASGNLPREYDPKNIIDDVKNIFKRDAAGVEANKIFKQEEEAKWEQTKQNAGVKELIKQSVIGDNKVDSITELKKIAPELTQTQFRQLENAVQKELAQEKLTPDQKLIFNFSAEELDKIAKDYPNRVADVEAVKQLKKDLNKQQNMPISGFTFKTEPGKSTGGFKFKAMKLKTPKKATGIKKPRLKAPTKVKLAKPKRIKTAKIPRVKPLKKIKRF